MTVIERIGSEIKLHQKAENDYKRSINQNKKDLYKLIDKSKEADFEEYKWGLIYEYSNSICTQSKLLKDLHDLVLVKMDLLGKLISENK